MNLGGLIVLPRLREIHLDELRGVSYEGTRIFPATVRMKDAT